MTAWQLFAFLVAVTLWLFTFRRAIFLATLYLPQPPLPANDDLPTVLVLAALRDEEEQVAPLAESLSQLDYPSEKMRVTLISDGSADSTPAKIEQAAGRENWSAVVIAQNVGKAEALNRAMSLNPFGEIIYVFDADHRPQPNCLQLAVRAFAESSVAGVSGRTIAANALASPAAFYAALEGMVHQLVTMRGRDVLGLGVALLGSNNGYRRSALETVGNLRRGVLLEDTELTLDLYKAGYRTRFVSEARSYHTVPHTVQGYWRQHVRWGRGFNDAARSHALSLLTEGTLSMTMRLDLILFSLGYLDRLAMLTAISLIITGQGAPVLLSAVAASLAMPLLQIVAVLLADRAPRPMWWRLVLAPAFFVLDILAAVWAMAESALRLPRVWLKTERG